MPSTTTFSEIRTDLIRDEGYRERPYRDSRGILTVGIGHNLEAEGLCRVAIFAQFDYDLRVKALDPLDKSLPWWRQQPEPVQRVLVNLCFNIGITGLLKFKTTLGHIQAGRYPQAADTLLASLYATQVGKRANRLADLLRSVL